jgi:hypothetical protein
MCLPADHGYISRAQALRILLDLELDLLSFFQVPVAFAADGGKVDKDVLTTVALNEPVALCGVEPFDSSSFSFRHVSPSFLFC